MWRRCAAALLRGPDAAAAAAVLRDVLATAVETIERRDLDADPRAQERADALLQVYAERDAGLAAPSEEARRAASALRRDLAEHRLGAAGEQRASALATALELEQGRWNDRAVDASALETWAAARDTRTLRWAAARLPDAALRADARRALVRVRVAGSAFPEVARDAAAVEAEVLRSGTNPVALDRHPALRGSLDPALAAPRRVVVEQRPLDGSARLLAESLAESTDARSRSVLPEVPLRGALLVSLEGISAPVTVCAPAEDLDPSPCLAPADVRADSSLARVGEDGVLRLVDVIGASAAADLARRGDSLALALAVGSRRVASLEWPLRFAAPPDLVLAGTGDGAPGPELEIRVDARDPARLVYSVDDGRRELQAVVEREDLGAFHVVTRGTRGSPGASGSSGSDGASGSDGWSATCPSSAGTDGSRGGDGAPGGAGGPGGGGGAGGSVHVSLLAAPEAREVLLATLRSTIRSEGGAGGPGGSGGAGGSGGRGGRGGSGTTCTDADGHVTTLSGGADGVSGSSGASGPSGPDGPAGPAGPVTFDSSIENNPS
jgi:hypothetical protein